MFSGTEDVSILNPLPTHGGYIQAFLVSAVEKYVQKTQM